MHHLPGLGGSNLSRQSVTSLASSVDHLSMTGIPMPPPGFQKGADDSPQSSMAPESQHMSQPHPLHQASLRSRTVGYPGQRKAIGIERETLRQQPSGSYMNGFPSTLSLSSLPGDLGGLGISSSGPALQDTKARNSIGVIGQPAKQSSSVDMGSGLLSRSSFQQESSYLSFSVQNMHHSQQAPRAMADILGLCGPTAILPSSLKSSGGGLEMSSHFATSSHLYQQPMQSHPLSQQSSLSGFPMDRNRRDKYPSLHSGFGVIGKGKGTLKL